MNRHAQAPIGKETARALARHAAETRGVIDDGDAGRIRRLYTDLAEELVGATMQDGTIPVLSFPETASAVADGLAGTGGLHLDVGCGPHPLASILLAADTDRPVVGVDIGLGMVTLAGQVAGGAGIRFHGVVCDAERLPFRDAVFGSVICDDTIEHVPDDDTAAAELARVTQAGGRIALATPNRIRLPVLFKRARDRVRRRNVAAHAYFAASSHLREYTWSELERLVRPHLDVVGRGHVPWTRSVAESAISRLTALPGGRVVGRVVLLFLSPKG